VETYRKREELVDRRDAAATSELTREEFLQRQEATRQGCGEQGWEALVAFARSFYDRPGHVAYLTNHFPPFPTAAFHGSYRGLGHAACVISKNGPVMLVVDGEYREDLVVAEEVRPGKDLAQAVADVLGKLGCRAATVGVAGMDVLPVGTYLDLQARLPQLRIVAADGFLWQLRSQKSPAEQTLLRRAAEVACVGLAAARKASEPGVPETHVAAVGTAMALRAGADFVRYLRVHSGPWSARGSRWPPATDRVLQAGDWVYLDLIGAVQGYQFDVLRTVVAGQPSSEQVRLLGATARALEAAIAVARPGQPARVVCQCALQVLAEEGLANYASRFAGHGIGLETVEPPLLTPEEDWVLKPGMVLCVEPKVSIPGWGGCSIEQEILLGDGKNELLTALPLFLPEAEIEPA
jgi:Xaa-Pro aminopeptidase